MRLIWTTRYSGSDKHDELGRWARVAYLNHREDPMKNIEIAWVKKLNGKFVCYVYLGSGFFDNTFETEKQAKEFADQSIKEFLENYLCTGT